MLTTLGSISGVPKLAPTGYYDGYEKYNYHGYPLIRLQAQGTVRPGGSTDVNTSYPYNARSASRLLVVSSSA
jgi:hypothetical protein